MLIINIPISIEENLYHFYKVDAIPLFKKILCTFLKLTLISLESQNQAVTMLLSWPKSTLGVPLIPHSVLC
jgi:hypothetical protein